MPFTHPNNSPTKSMALSIAFFSAPPKSNSSLWYPPLTTHCLDFLHLLKPKPTRRDLTSAVVMFSDNTVVSDIIAGGLSGAILAALIPAVNIIKMLLLGLGVWTDDATVKFMSRFGDHRELLKGPLYYASTITLASAIYWRTSPISIAAICNLCAGDGMADIVGRRFGNKKLSYNSNKSIIGSITMASAGFLASIGCMLYFSSFGYVHESSEMVLGFLIVSIVAALVESHLLSTELDDNLTVPFVSVLVGSLVL